MSQIKRRELLVLVVLLSAAGGVQLWLRGRTEAARDALGPRIAGAARAGDVEMISSTGCVYCAKARSWLTRHHVVFGECNIDLDTRCLTRFQQLGSPGTPVMMVRGKPQLGFDPQRVAQGLGLETPE